MLTLPWRVRQREGEASGRVHFVTGWQERRVATWHPAAFDVDGAY
jgi:hypothetical protein